MPLSSNAGQSGWPLVGRSGNSAPPLWKQEGVEISGAAVSPQQPGVPSRSQESPQQPVVTARWCTKVTGRPLRKQGQGWQPRLVQPQGAAHLLLSERNTLEFSTHHSSVPALCLLASHGHVQGSQPELEDRCPIYRGHGLGCSPRLETTWRLNLSADLNSTDLPASGLGANETLARICLRPSILAAPLPPEGPFCCDWTVFGHRGRWKSSPAHTGEL